MTDGLWLFGALCLTCLRRENRAVYFVYVYYYYYYIAAPVYAVSIGFVIRVNVHRMLRFS